MTVFRAILVALACALFGSLASAQVNGDKTQAPPQANVPKELLEQRVQSALKIFKVKLGVRNTDNVDAPTAAELGQWSRRLLDAQIALHQAQERPNPEDGLKFYRQHLQEVSDIEKVFQQLFKSGQIRADQAEVATYYRLEAEILFVQAGGKLPKKGD